MATSPASEPETQAIEDYVRTLFPDRRGPADADAAPVRYRGAIHQPAFLQRADPLSLGLDQTPRRRMALALQTLGRKFGYYTGYQVCQVCESRLVSIWPTAPLTTGAYGELGVASYTFELGTAFFQSCSVFENQILDREYRRIDLRHEGRTPSL